LSTRFKRISAITDQWSAGDFSRYIGDATGDEIAQFTRRLDKMAEQLQSLLRRRQDMAISEERNRLARDLRDSAKQQALVVSFELGTALALFERDPQATKKHLVAGRPVLVVTFALIKFLTSSLDKSFSMEWLLQQIRAPPESQTGAGFGCQNQVFCLGT
jgi:hypothetical protein